MCRGVEGMERSAVGRVEGVLGREFIRSTSKIPEITFWPQAATPQEQELKIHSISHIKTPFSFMLLNMGVTREGTRTVGARRMKKEQPSKFTST